jgi:hypothetical protein
MKKTSKTNSTSHSQPPGITSGRRRGFFGGAFGSRGGGMRLPRVDLIHSAANRESFPASHYLH